MRVQKMVYMNAGFGMRLLFNVMKLFLSKTIRERHVLVNDKDGFLRDSFYSKDVLPTQFNGLNDYNDLQTDLSNKLQERYKLAATFKL